MRHVVLLFITAISLGCGAASKGSTLPKETAAHFCRLLVNDGEGHVSTLGSYIRRHQTETSDSLTLEQLFTTYVFNYDGWKTLRIFPHCTKGETNWYAATDALPDELGSEHQKYINEVFLRLNAEVKADNWANVDAYIDRMVQYQCRFGSASHTDAPHQMVTATVAILFLLFLLVPVLRLGNENKY